MTMEADGNLGRELRQMADVVRARHDLEDGHLDKQRLHGLGQILLIAADMADDCDGVEVDRPLPDTVATAWFDDIVYREWPDGVPSSGPDDSRGPSDE